MRMLWYPLAPWVPLTPFIPLTAIRSADFRVIGDDVLSEIGIAFPEQILEKV